MSYIQAILALIPLFKQLLDLFIKTPDEKRAEFLAKLPVMLKEIDDAFSQAAEQKDPSDISRIINNG